LLLIKEPRSEADLLCAHAALADSVVYGNTPEELSGVMAFR